MNEATAQCALQESVTKMAQQFIQLGRADARRLIQAR